jgi:hypothetical protein
MLNPNPIIHSNPRDVQEWAAHVYASSSIPPPPIIPPRRSETAITSPNNNEDRCNRLLHFRAEIPNSIRTAIGEHLQSTIGHYDTLSLAADIPQPITNPLVCILPWKVHMYVLNRNRLPRSFPMCKESQKNTTTSSKSEICTGFSEFSSRCNCRHDTLLASPSCMISVSGSGQ